MGLAEVIQGATKTAIAATGNIPISTTYHSSGTYTYEADDGTNTEGNDDADHTLSFVFANFSANAIDGQTILATDMKALIAVNDFPSITPQMKLDYITVASGKWAGRWNIFGQKLGPGLALYEFYSRRAD